jgi:hypothetical protein
VDAQIEQFRAALMESQQIDTGVHTGGYVGGCAKTEVALRDELPSASVVGRVRGCRLAARHGPGPAVPAALGPVCGMSGSFCTVRRRLRGTVTDAAAKSMTIRAGSLSAARE